MTADTNSAQPAVRRETDPGAKVVGFVLIIVWSLFLSAPFWSSPGMRDGIFLASPEWNNHAPWAIMQGTLVGIICLALVLAITTLCLFPAVRELATKRGFWRATAIALAVMLSMMPLWGWGLERGLLRIVAHNGAPTLETVEREAVVSSYYVTKKRRRGELERLNLRVPPYGRLQIQSVPNFAPGFVPEKGMTLAITGRRTWVGTYYDTLKWPQEWLAAD